MFGAEGFPPGAVFTGGCRVTQRGGLCQDATAALAEPPCPSLGHRAGICPFQATPSSFCPVPAPPEELPGSPLSRHWLQSGCESPWSRSGSFQAADAVGWLQAAQGSAGGALGLLCAAPVLQPGPAQPACNVHSALLAPPLWKFPSCLHPFYRLRGSDSDHPGSTSGNSRSVESYKLHQFGVEL